MRTLKDQAIIAGIGQTEFSKASGRSELQLAAEAALAAIKDAGMTPSDIEGLVTFTLDSSDELLLMRTLGIPELRYWSRTPHGGAEAHTTVQHAALAVASGAAKAVLVYRAFNERSGRRFGQPNARVTPPGWNWYLPFGLDTPAKIYALQFQRYMHEYGLTNEDFGRYTVVARKHAATNPSAWFYERPITLEDHQNSRWIVEPIIRLLDCCQESDGGVAIVVTAAERANDLPNPAAIPRIDRPAASPREISSRSSSRNRVAARRRGSGRIPPHRIRYARTVPVDSPSCRAVGLAACPVRNHPQTSSTTSGDNL